MNSEKQKKTNGSLSRLQRLFVKNTESTPVKEINFFEVLFQSTLNAYIIYNKETLEVIDINKKLRTLFELPPDNDLKGLYMSQVMMRHLASDNPNLDILMNNISDSWTGEAKFITHSKNTFYGLVNTNILLNAPGEYEYQVLSIKDITELKDAKDEVLKSKISVEQAASSKARFLSSMSHELRTPLNGIIGSSNLMLSETDLDEDLKNNIEVIRYSSEHMLGIINDILDFSKIDAQKMEVKEQAFSLINCLNNVTSSFTQQYKSQDIDLIINLPVQDLQNVYILSDQMKLSQVINNLLSNSLKFTIAGSVELIVKIKELSDTNIILYFEVKDTGIGIAKEKQKEVFQAFSQIHSDELKRKYGGTGLGLNISQQLVNILGGTLEVSSELGVGSHFYFTLNLKIAAPPVIKNTPIPLPESGKDIRGVRVLIVEDNEINANILKGFLRKWQMQVKEAITGVHALELLKYHKFDLILMDLEMPEMNGYTTLNIIREKGMEVPVIAFTATLLENMESLVTEAGFTDYILKPFRPSDLKKKIETYCQRKIDYA